MSPLERPASLTYPPRLRKADQSGGGTAHRLRMHCEWLGAGSRDSLLCISTASQSFDRAARGRVAGDHDPDRVRTCADCEPRAEPAIRSFGR